MGLRHRVRTFLGAHRHARALDASLQLASPSSRHPWRRADESFGSIRKQPLDASQLDKQTSYSKKLKLLGEWHVIGLCANALPAKFLFTADILIGRQAGKGEE